MPPRFTPRETRTVKYCLSLVKTKAEWRGRTLHIRPENVTAFGQLLGKHGLSECEAAKRMIVWLNERPAETIKFTVARR